MTSSKNLYSVAKPTVRRTVIINRAVPGSGKTSLSKRLIEQLESRGLRVGYHSTDDFFITDDGRYGFEAHRLPEVHAQNVANFMRSLESGLEVAICDNTNLSPWESAPYMELARQHGYAVVVLDFLPRALIKHSESQRVSVEKPDAHEVPDTVLRHMIGMSHRFRHLLDKTCPVDPLSDFKIVWDHVADGPKQMDEVLTHYDADFVVSILPEDFQRYKEIIGEVIWSRLLVK